MKKLLGGVIGVVLGLAFVEYHNAHVSIWTGGWRFNGFGYLIVMIFTGSIGFALGSILDKADKK